MKPKVFTSFRSFSLSFGCIVKLAFLADNWLVMWLIKIVTMAGQMFPLHPLGVDTILQTERVHECESVCESENKNKMMCKSSIILNNPIDGLNPTPVHMQWEMLVISVVYSRIGKDAEMKSGQACWECLAGWVQTHRRNHSVGIKNGSFYEESQGRKQHHQNDLQTYSNTCPERSQKVPTTQWQSRKTDLKGDFTNMLSLWWTACWGQWDVPVTATKTANLVSTNYRAYIG